MSPCRAARGEAERARRSGRSAARVPAASALRRGACAAAPLGVQRAPQCSSACADGKVPWEVPPPAHGSTQRGGPRVMPISSPATAAGSGHATARRRGRPPRRRRGPRRPPPGILGKPDRRPPWSLGERAGPSLNGLQAVRASFAAPPPLAVRDRPSLAARREPRACDAAFVGALLLPPAAPHPRISRHVTASGPDAVGRFHGGRVPRRAFSGSAAPRKSGDAGGLASCPAPRPPGAAGTRGAAISWDFETVRRHRPKGLETARGDSYEGP